MDLFCTWFLQALARVLAHVCRGQHGGILADRVVEQGRRHQVQVTEPIVAPLFALSPFRDERQHEG